MELSFNGIVFNYSLTDTTKPRYFKVLNVYMIDPVSGKRMKKKKTRVPLLGESDTYYTDIRKSVYFGIGSVITDKAIKKEAIKCAEQLYAEHETTLLRKLKERPEIGSIDSNLMYLRYIDDYMRTQNKATEATQKEKRRILKNACVFLNTKPISKLTDKDIGKLLANKTFNTRKNLIRDFFEYCRNKGAYPGVNPIIKYLDSHNTRVLKRSKRTYPSTLSHIPLENEIALHNLIVEHIDDNEIMALILVKCANLSLTDACKMRWSDIDEVSGHYIIKGQKNNTGSFHRLDRPILYEGSVLIALRKERLRKKRNSRKPFEQTRVVPLKKKKGSNPISRVTVYIRNMLIQAGLKPSDISAIDTNTRQKGGTGVILLHKHYEYVLRERCGMDLDSPEGRFMRGLVPGDTTNKYYRSLSDRYSGIPYFLTIVRRDDFFLARCFDSPTVDAQKEGDKVVYRIHAAGPGRKLVVTIPDAYLQEGTRITIRSKYGVTANITFKDILSTNDIEEKIIY